MSIVLFYWSCSELCGIFNNWKSGIFGTALMQLGDYFVDPALDFFHLFSGHIAGVVYKTALVIGALTAHTDKETVLLEGAVDPHGVHAVGRGQNG